VSEELAQHLRPHHVRNAARTLYGLDLRTRRGDVSAGTVSLRRAACFVARVCPVVAPATSEIAREVLGIVSASTASRIVKECPGDETAVTFARAIAAQLCVQERFERALKAAQDAARKEQAA
jgi:hypothetical protein